MGSTLPSGGLNDGGDRGDDRILGPGWRVSEPENGDDERIAVLLRASSLGRRNTLKTGTSKISLGSKPAPSVGMPVDDGIRNMMKSVFTETRPVLLW